MYIGEPQVAAAEAVGELFVVEAHEVEDGGPEVIDGADVFGGVVAELIGGAVDVAAFDAATGHPDGKAVGIVVAAVGALGEGRATEFAGPDDERAVEQAAGFEVLDERGDGPVDLVRHLAVAFFDRAVMVPRIGCIAAAEVVGERAELDEAHATLHESPGEQALAGVGGFFRLGIVEAVEFLGCLGLAGDVAEVGHGGLHAPGHLVVRNGGFDVRVVLRGAGKALVHRANEVELTALEAVRLSRANVGDGFGLIGLHDAGLVLRRQEAIAEKAHAAMRCGRAAALQHDVTGQIA